MKIKNNKKEICTECEKQIAENNSVPQTGVCIDCQSARFKRLEESNGTHLALFLTCAAFNLPCDPDIVPIDLSNYEGDKWKRYIELLRENSRDTDKSGAYRTFADGVSDIREVFGRELTEKDFARYISAEQRKAAAMPGTEEQRERWGTGLDYTDDDYDELDRRLQNRLETYKGMTITPQMSDILIKVCKYDYEGDRAVEEGDTKKAKDLFDIVDKALASENMRKKDEKPVENFRIDSQIKALEASELFRDGQFLTFEETVDVIMRKYFKRRKYSYSIDVLDHVIEDMYNGLRANADLVTSQTLPDYLQPDDEFGEFESEETETERNNKRYAQLTKVQYAPDGGE